MSMLARFSSLSAPAAAAPAEAIDFDGTNDYLSRSSDLTGNADGKTFTFSAWVWCWDTTGNAIYSVRTGGGDRFYIVASTSSIVIFGRNASNVNILNATATLGSAGASLATMSHVLVSIDLTNTSNRSVYINDVAASVTWTTYTNDNIDFTTSTIGVGSAPDDASGRTWGRLSNVFLDYTYRDLSVTANRRLFVTADLKPAAGQAALNPLIYLPMNDPTAPGTNAGTGGNFTLTGTVARSGRGPNQYNAPYSDLDGTADYLERTTAPTGIADGKAFTLHFSFNADTFVPFPRILHFATSATARLQVYVTDTGVLTIIASNAAGTAILNATVANLVIGRNYVVTISVDLADTNKRAIYINGVLASTTWTTYTNDAIDFAITSTPRYRIGSNSDLTPSQYLNGRLGDVFFHTSYIDLSVASNLAKFVTGTGIDAKPADLGADGSAPLGVQPLIYLPMYGNNAGKNYGTGGDFTVNSGPYTGARGPNEFWGNLANFDGTSSVLARTSALTGISDGKTFSLSFYVSPGVISGGEKWLSFSNAGSLRGVAISFSNTNLRFFAYNSSGTAILDATCGTAYGAGSTYWVQISVDLSNSANRGIYINGLLDSTTWSTYSNATISFTTGSDVRIGQDQASSFPPGKLSELYFTTEYIDFSQEANRLKFRDAFDNPTDLPAAIAAQSIPNPAIYMRFDPASFGTNSGTGGNFTVNGTITDGGQL